MAHQEALTVVCPVDATKADALQACLEGMRPDPGHNATLPFGLLPGCHFGRLLILPATQDLQGQTLDAHLVMLIDCDGSAQDMLEKLVATAGAGIDAVFGHCRDYPRSPAGAAERLAYLQGHRAPTPANYVHRPGRTVEQIRNEAKLRDALQAFVDANDFSSSTAQDVRRRILDFVAREASLQWALQPPPSIGIARRALDLVDLVARPLGVVAFGPVVLPAAALLMLLVRLQEMRDRSEHLRPSPEHVRRLSELEDFVAHNGFTAAGLVKRGWVRQAVLATVLPLIGWGTRHLFTRDSLAGVKSIHFARWIPLEGGRRVVFASNYDGSLESYNNDFIDLVSWGLNLVFSNGEGYPPTRWLLFGGATYEQEFKDFLRRHQLPTTVWYSAYPHLSAVNIERNAKLRAGLQGEMSEEEAQRWLRLL